MRPFLFVLRMFASTRRRSTSARNLSLCEPCHVAILIFPHRTCSLLHVSGGCLPTQFFLLGTSTLISYCSAFISSIGAVYFILTASIDTCAYTSTPRDRLLGIKIAPPESDHLSIDHHIRTCIQLRRIRRSHSSV